MEDCLKEEIFKTPIGNITAIADNDYLYFLGFIESKKNFNIKKILESKTKKQFFSGTNEIIELLRNELRNYFEGRLKKFSLSIKTFGTDFQKEVWECLCTLEYGKTMSYGELATACGYSVKYARAVGNAAGSNRIIIIIPCHRLTASENKLGGFSCGKEKKQWLLNHERHMES